MGSLGGSSSPSSSSSSSSFSSTAYAGEAAAGAGDLFPPNKDRAASLPALIPYDAIPPPYEPKASFASLFAPSANALIPFLATSLRLGNNSSFYS